MAALVRDPRRTVIVLPDLHEEDVAELALELARLPHARLIVESRSASPAHLLLAGGDCAELDLDLAQWRDQGRFDQWQASQPDDHAATEPAPRAVGAEVDLSDPVVVCGADPWLVTAAYERFGGQDHGGLAAAWFRAGQSLCREQPPASRALTLLGVLGDSADPRLAPALAELAAGAGWRVAWSRVRGDVAPPWPGPATTLAMGRGPLAGCVLTAGPDGCLKAVNLADATARGRSPGACPEPVALTVLSDGTVLMLDENGRAQSEGVWAGRAAGSGIEGLLGEEPSGCQRLLASLQGHTGTALASTTGPDIGVVALGDATGTVRVFGDVADSVCLHEGPVTALAALALPLGGESTVPLLYSGGADGTVRAWSPGRAPMADALLVRPCPVVSLDAAVFEDGAATVVAWGDGVVECLYWDTGARRAFRPGPPVRAVALDEVGRVVVGMDEALTCLFPRQSRAGGDVV
ncbi:hypothetical protein AB0M39_21820 [Streptomyces sp. NPDC051907]|uniref:hypothetical protein n=1 Tax=Streptomyces sp. NPDC051907 TaxID=3155284 RepID=UPI0034230CB7